MEDDLLPEFVAEASESLSVLDAHLDELEREPTDPDLLAGVLRCFRTIKGASDLLGLSRLAALSASAENVVISVREERMADPSEAVGQMRASRDRMQDLLATLEADGTEPAGDDADLIGRLDALAGGPPAGPARPGERRAGERRAGAEVAVDVIIRTVDRGRVRRNLVRHGPDLVAIADELLGRLDQALAEEARRQHNKPPDAVADDATETLSALRDDVRRFRDALVAAVADPAGQAEPVVHDGARLVKTLATIADHPLVQRPALGIAAVGVSALALSVGVPVDPTITLGLFVAGPEGAKAFGKALGKLELK